MIKVHTFESSSDAYDWSQTSDHITDGDVLFVPSEQVAAVLFKAWPVTPKATYLTDKDGAFHAPQPHVTVEELVNDFLDTGDDPHMYDEAIVIAKALCSAAKDSDPDSWIYE
jgi:hypothetical protein